MASAIYKTAHQLVIFFTTVAVLQSTSATKDDFSSPENRGGSGSAIASGSGALLTPVAIPTCVTDEFLSSDGEQLVCRIIPPCTCFVGSSETSSEPGPDSTVPLPPTGCPVYDPPLRGATTCYLNSTINLMFCSVYCDHNFEFLSTPHNPYFCGPSTNFQWVDATDRLNVFPECTGHRITTGTIHSIRNYLPSPCYGLSDHTILAIMSEFRQMLRNIGHSLEVDGIFMQCPSFDGRVYHYNDVKIRATHKRKKRYSENKNNLFNATND